MTGQQRKVLGVFVLILVVGFVVLGIRSTKRKREQERRLQHKRIQSQKARLRKKPVVFAKENIKKRTEIRKEWLEIKEVEERDLPKQDYASDFAQVVGKIARVNIYHGEPVVFVRIADRNAVPALSFVIKKGMRAVPIRVKTVDACGGFLKQNDRVDILSTFNLREPGINGTKDYGKVTTYLMSDVKVLAINRVYHLEKKKGADGKTPGKKPKRRKKKKKGKKGKNANNPYRAKPNISMVTFEVSPEDAEKLIIASKQTKLKLILRPEGGAAPIEGMEAINLEQIAGRQEVTKQSNENPSEVRVEFIKAQRKQDIFLRVRKDEKAPPELPEAPPEEDKLNPDIDSLEFGTGDLDEEIEGVELPDGF